MFRQKLPGGALCFPRCFAVFLHFVPLLVPSQSSPSCVVSFHSPADLLTFMCLHEFLFIPSFLTFVLWPSRYPILITPLDSCLYQTPTLLPSCPAYPSHGLDIVSVKFPLCSPPSAAQSPAPPQGSVSRSAISMFDLIPQELVFVGKRSWSNNTPHDGRSGCEVWRPNVAH